MNSQTSPDLTRTTLGVLIIGVLLVASLWTMQAFIGPLVWATAIVVATWPLLMWVQRHLGNSRALATTVMVIVMLVIFVVPFWAALGVMLDASVDGVEVVRSYMKTGLGPPPDWLAKVPVAGERLTAKWQTLSAAGPEQFAETIRPYVKSVAAWLLAVTGGFGGLLGHFLLTVIIAGILYAQGEAAAMGVRAFASRLAGQRGDAAVILAGQSVQSVALGVVVTALVQTVLVGLGFFVAGIPHPGLLTAIVFVLCIAQVGPILVLIPAVIWMYSHASGVAATVFLIYSIPMALLDNFLRPILISRGVDLPLILIIAGVIGGLLAFGVIGLFIGPVILAVTYSSLGVWIADKPASEAKETS
ncbi:MAG TPA: AI-2E family transporter YdiK [Steroidobacteraceae bacterium]|nr:AI-2E family transporter YdiK [Steroidobacteraceae bacterium]